MHVRLAVHKALIHHDLESQPIYYYISMLAVGSMKSPGGGKKPFAAGSIAT
jgi:hypothetical protein